MPPSRRWSSPILSVERSRRRSDLLVISAVGEIDATSARMLRRATWDDLAPVTVLDLAKVTLLGAAGLRALAVVAHRAHTEDRVVALVSPPYPVSVVLLTFWNDRRVLLYSTLAEALRAHPATTGP